MMGLLALELELEMTNKHVGVGELINYIKISRFLYLVGVGDWKIPPVFVCSFLLKVSRGRLALPLGAKSYPQVTFLSKTLAQWGNPHEKT